MMLLALSLGPNAFSLKSTNAQPSDDMCEKFPVVKVGANGVRQQPRPEGCEGVAYKPDLFYDGRVGFAKSNGTYPTTLQIIKDQWPP